MIASAQFTIISLCDVVTSDTPPENPYEGQLWVDTSVTPPETKIWDGNEWVVQNDIETIGLYIFDRLVCQLTTMTRLPSRVSSARTLRKHRCITRTTEAIPRTGLPRIWC